MPDTSKEVQDFLKRRQTLKSRRMNFESTWQELAEVLNPRRADFTWQRVAGERRTDNVYDSVPMQARRSLATAIDGLVKPKAEEWFRIVTDEPEVNEDDEARRWLDEAKRRMRNAIYNPAARFIQRTGEVDNDLVTFGTASLFIGEARETGRLIFRSHHLRDVLIAENDDGVVDTIFLTIPFTARQAIQRFGEENVGSHINDLVKQDPDKEVELLQVVQPREERDYRRRDARSLPFASCVLDVRGEHKIAESGFHEFPFAVPRWDTASGEVYGRSPGMIALPDAETLQAMGKTLLIGGQRRVDPPLWVTHDGVLSPVRTFPGGITTIDGRAMRELGRQPFGELTSGAEIPIGREMQNDTREQVWAAFFRNVLFLPQDQVRRTATEVLERKEEMLRAIGPVFGQLESDYIRPIVERTFAIMLRAGAFPEPPDILRGRDVQFIFESPVARARRQVEAAAFARSMELVAPLLPYQPQMLDHIDGDAIVRDMPEMGGFPIRWIKPEDRVAAQRQQRAEAQQAREMIAQGAEVATAASKVVPLFQQEEQGAA